MQPLTRHFSICFSINSSCWLVAFFFVAFRFVCFTCAINSVKCCGDETRKSVHYKCNKIRFTFVLILNHVGVCVLDFFRCCCCCSVFHHLHFAVTFSFFLQFVMWMATPIIIDEYYTRKRINDTVNLLSNLLLSLPVRREREKEPSNDTKHSVKLFAPHRHIIQTGNPTSHEWLRICICICIGWFMAEIGGVVVVAAAGAFLSFRFHTSAWKCPVCRVRYQTAFEVIGNSVGVCGHYENWHLRFETIDTLTLVLLVCVWVCHHMETVPGQAPVWSKNEEKERISSGHLHFWNIYNGIVGCTFQTCVISFFISLR